MPPLWLNLDPQSNCLPHNEFFYEGSPFTERNISATVFRARKIVFMLWHL